MSFRKEGIKSVREIFPRKLNIFFKHKKSGQPRRKDLAEAVARREAELTRLKDALVELDRIAKMLVRRDLELSVSKQELVAQKTKIDAVVDSLVDGLIMVDQEQRIILINPEARAVLGVEGKDVLSKTLEQLKGKAGLKNLYLALGGKVEWVGRQYELVFGKPLRRFFQVRTAPVVTLTQETIGLMITLHDVTREKEIEQMKTEFVSIVAHQLRTPLSATKWILRMLLDGDFGQLAKEQRAFLERGYQSNERMIALINDLLDVARIEEGRFVYSPALYSLESLISRIVDNIKELAKASQIKLNWQKPKTPLPKVRIDVEKMGLVIQNLLDNAIHYSPKGKGVTISIKNDKLNVEVMIEDEGIGIPQYQKKRVFSKFFRADNAARLEARGTGLGLFISKNIIEAHGGKIWFESKEGKGSTFWFSLPISAN